MSGLVVDASVGAKWFLVEESSDKATELSVRPDLHAPDFLLLELDNVFTTYMRRGNMTQVDAREARERLAKVNLHLHHFVPLRDEAFAIASQTGRSCYDCLYVALAMALAGRVVTADRRLLNALRETPFGPYVAWIEDV